MGPGYPVAPLPFRLSRSLGPMPRVARLASAASIRHVQPAVWCYAEGYNVVGLGARSLLAVGADGVAGQDCGSPLLMLVVVSALMPGAALAFPLLPVRRAIATLHEGSAAGRGTRAECAAWHRPLMLQNVPVPVTLRHLWGWSRPLCPRGCGQCHHRTTGVPAGSARRYANTAAFLGDTSSGRTIAPNSPAVA